MRTCIYNVIIDVKYVVENALLHSHHYYQQVALMSKQDFLIGMFFRLSPSSQPPLSDVTPPRLSPPPPKQLPYMSLLVVILVLCVGLLLQHNYIDWSPLTPIFQFMIIRRKRVLHGRFVVLN